MKCTINVLNLDALPALSTFTRLLTKDTCNSFSCLDVILIVNV